MARSHLSYTLLFVTLAVGCDGPSLTPREALAASAQSEDASADASVEADASASADASVEVDASASADASVEADASDHSKDAGTNDAALRDAQVSAADGGSPDEPAPVPLTRPFRSGSRLKARYYKYEGAPDMFAGMLDTETQKPCRFVPTGGGFLHCLPEHNQLNGLVQVGYLDSACKQAIYRPYDGCGEIPRVLTRFGRNCSGDAELHSLDPIRASVPYYRVSAAAGVPNGCAMAGSSTEPGWLSEGGGQPLTAYVQGSERLIASSGGLTRAVIVGSDGSVAAGEIVTKAQRLACLPDFTPELAPCHLDTPVSYGGPMRFYTDDACSMEVMRDYVHSYSWSAPDCPAPEYLVDITQEGSGSYGARRIGKRVTEVLYAPWNGCQLVDNEFTSRPLFEVGEVVQLPKLKGVLKGSGRLAARLYEDEAGNVLGGDASKDALYRDKQANVACTPTALPGGYYCLPQHTAVLPNDTGLEIFGDASCSTRLFACAGDNCSEALFVTTGASAACQPTENAAVWRPGARYRGPRYMLDGLGGCMPDPNDPTLAQTWLRTRVAPETFPKLELQSDARSLTLP